MCVEFHSETCPIDFSRNSSYIAIAGLPSLVDFCFQSPGEQEQLMMRQMERLQSLVTEQQKISTLYNPGTIRISFCELNDG